MYTLTLTHEERQEIDWVGDHYRHGHELYTLLCECTDADWDSPSPITYAIPEHIARTISEIIDEGLSCFADSLRAKLYTFKGGIV